MFSPCRFGGATVEWLINNALDSVGCTFEAAHLNGGEAVPADLGVIDVDGGTQNGLSCNVSSLFAEQDGESQQQQGRVRLSAAGEGAYTWDRLTMPPTVVEPCLEPVLHNFSLRTSRSNAQAIS